MHLTNGVANIFCRVIVHFGKVGFASAMRTYDRYEARDSYKRAQDAMGENIRVGNDDIESNGRRFPGTLPDIVATMRSLIKAQEEQHQLNAAMLQSLTDIHQRMSLG